MKSKESVIALNIRAARLIGGRRKWLIPGILLSSLFNNLSPYITIYMSAKIVNELAGGRNTQRLMSLVLFAIIADLTAIIVGRLFTKLVDYEKQSFEFCEMRMFIEHGFNLDFAHLEDPDIRKRRRKIDESKNINSFGIWRALYDLQNISEAFIQIILSICFTSSLFILMIKQAGDMIGTAIFTIVIVTLIALSIFVSTKNASKLSNLGDEISNNMLYINRIGNNFTDQYHMGKDVRLYGLWGLIKQHNKLTFDAQVEGNKKYWFGYRNTQIPGQVISQGINFSIYAFVCLNAVRGLLEIGSVIQYVGFITRLVTAVTNLTDYIALTKMNTPFLLHYLSFFEIENKMYNGSIPVEKRADNEYEIEFHNVSFKYPGSDSYALKNLSLKLNIGQRLAVVGMNGSGKTTMIKLLCRLYDPTEGEITLNGIDIRKYRYHEYMKVFSVVFQDFKLFSFSLGQNTAASVEVETDRAMDSLNKAGFADRFSTMPKGLDTPLHKDFEEDGVEISGGEAQKIALARALYKNAPFIVLDEPTAALDPIAEFDIYSKFNEIVGGKTAIYISHRLSSCRFCDDIAVFHEGELIQRGNHDALLDDKDGKYFELWNAQAQYYTEQK